MGKRCMLLGFAAVLCSCSKEDGLSKVDESESVEVVSPMPEIEMRTSVGGAFAQGDFSEVELKGEVVRTVGELREGLKKGLRIFQIPADAEVVLETKHLSLILPAGVEIRSHGGTIRIPANDKGAGVKGAVILTQGDCLLEGVRLLGPTRNGGTSDQLIGIQGTKGVLTVRNCEVTGWPWAGVSIKASKGVVEYSIVHHNLFKHLGYGVVVQNGNAEVMIRGCLFENNRHSIAGSGARGEVWIAEDNIQLPGGTRHAFDMHGIGGVAGEAVVMRGNLFAFGGGRYGHYPSLAVRGMPSSGPAVVTRNRFTSRRLYKDGMNRQKEVISGPAKVDDSNEFGVQAPELSVRADGRLWGDAKYFQEAAGSFDWNEDGRDELIRFGDDGVGYYSASGLSEWEVIPEGFTPKVGDLSPVLDADFDGDGEADGIRLISVREFKRPW